MIDRDIIFAWVKNLARDTVPVVGDFDDGDSAIAEEVGDGDERTTHEQGLAVQHRHGPQAACLPFTEIGLRCGLLQQAHRRRAHPDPLDHRRDVTGIDRQYRHPALWPDALALQLTGNLSALVMDFGPTAPLEVVDVTGAKSASGVQRRSEHLRQESIHENIPFWSY